MIDYRMETGDEDFLERVENIKADILEEKKKTVLVAGTC